ncbi:MAG: hypothetical protein EA403_01310 [Spirochaetaceae bacterium]|nr:MAG: hypothetical protein EA403_01310 [Spirochaetaceae bacterium]
MQRIRLAGVQAPELTRANQKYGDPGYEAYRYTSKRLSAARGTAELISSRMGKWRRWIGIWTVTIRGASEDTQPVVRVLIVHAGGSLPLASEVALRVTLFRYPLGHPSTNGHRNVLCKETLPVCTRPLPGRDTHSRDMM